MSNAKLVETLKEMLDLYSDRSMGSDAFSEEHHAAVEAAIAALTPPAMTPDIDALMAEASKFAKMLRDWSDADLRAESRVRDVSAAVKDKTLGYMAASFVEKAAAALEAMQAETASHLESLRITMEDRALWQANAERAESESARLQENHDLLLELHGTVIIERDAALKERDALKPDAERYRWLRNRPPFYEIDTPFPKWNVVIEELHYTSDDYRNGSLDAAIDAARSKPNVA